MSSPRYISYLEMRATLLLILIAADDRDCADVLVRETAQVAREAVTGDFQLSRLGPPRSWRYIS